MYLAMHAKDWTVLALVIFYQVADTPPFNNYLQTL